MDEENRNLSVITRLERQKKNKHRINVYLNDEYAFAIHEDVLVKYRLNKGRELDEADMKELLEAEEKSRAVQYGLNYISHRPRTAEEVRKYLMTKGFPNPAVEEAVAGFIERKYIDDKEYARLWVEERLRLKPRGRHLLRQELQARGIGPDDIEAALEGIGQEEEETACLELARKKYARRHFDSFQEMRNKVGPFLQRKGFSHDMIKKTIEKLKNDKLDERM
ncbi:RecX family transcriptional regulator [Aneurinibacillus migulanus]|uniref:RecX family transcriptional regulator n=1 Tax=Aneurinibacillus migulanus TaxID=47500 RepID=UPI0006986941|nr:RecX family transcriptional regulator [Aneurinibacillus migulanus]MCP1354095.1 RecX family transcriptional regulator [Aneurinibacillus migulanus]